MKEQLTTYTVKAKSQPNVWVFKYHLNGTLKTFDVLEGLLDEKQIKWLFEKGNFPYHESQIKGFDKIRNQEKKLVFDVEKGLPDTSFEAFWAAYDRKVKITRSKQLWKKLSPAHRLRALEGIKRYDNYLRRHNGIAKMNPDTYIYQQRWQDDFNNL